MISHLSGIARRWNEDDQSVEIDVQGVWYEVHLPAFCWRALEAHRPERLELAIFYYVPDRNPTPVLIGFQRPVERAFFRKFVQVPGMGPARARRALTTSVSTVARWIENENRAALRTLPGVGPRQTDQIIAELKGKVVAEALLVDEHYTEAAPPPPPEAARVVEDATTALVNLGYRERDARAWVEAAVAESGLKPPDTEAVLRAVLRQVAASH